MVVANFKEIMDDWIVEVLVEEMWILIPQKEKPLPIAGYDTKYPLDIG